MENIASIWALGACFKTHELPRRDLHKATSFERKSNSFEKGIRSMNLLLQNMSQQFEIVREEKSNLGQT